MMSNSPAEGTDTAPEAELIQKLARRHHIIENGGVIDDSKTTPPAAPTISSESSDELAYKLRERLHVLGEEETSPAAHDKIKQRPLPSPSKSSIASTPSPSKPAAKPVTSTPSPQPPPVPAQRPAPRPAVPAAHPPQAPVPTQTPPKVSSVPVNKVPRDQRLTLCVFYVTPLSLLVLTYLILTARSAYLFFVQLPSLSNEDIFPALPQPELTVFSPSGLRVASPNAWLALPAPRASRTPGESLTRAGESYLAVPPVFANADGVLEDEFVYAGGVMDDSGLWIAAPHAGNASLVAVDLKLGGLRRWALALQDGEVPAGGVPLLLQESAQVRRKVRGTDAAGLQQVLLLGMVAALTLRTVYHATRHRAYALRASDGQPVWGPVPTYVEPGPGLQGLHYHPPSDSLVGLTSDGAVFVLNRKTGARAAESKRLPCAPWTTESSACVLHPMAQSKTSGRMFLVATARDEQDGTADGLSSRAALYVFDLVQGEADSSLPLRLRVTSQLVLAASLRDVGPPVVSADGSLVVLGDQSGRLTAFFTESLLMAWTVENLGRGALAVALASDEDGLVAYVTSQSGGLTKLGPLASPDKVPAVLWQRDSLFEAMQGRLTGLFATQPLVAANGLVLGVNVETTNRAFSSGHPVRSGVALLDRATGATRYFAFAAGPRISHQKALALGLDGAILALHSTGGLSIFNDANAFALARDIACAAARRADNALAVGGGGWLTSAPKGADEALREDAIQVAVLCGQALVGLHGKEDPIVSELRQAWDATAPALTTYPLLGAQSLLKSARGPLERVCRAP